MTPIHLSMSKEKAMSRKTICPDSSTYCIHRCLSHTSIWNKQMVTFHETKQAIPISQLKLPYLQKNKEEQSDFLQLQFLYRAHGEESQPALPKCQEPGRLWVGAQALLAGSCVRVRHSLSLSLTCVSNLQLLLTATMQHLTLTNVSQKKNLLLQKHSARSLITTLIQLISTAVHFLQAASDS